MALTLAICPYVRQVLNGSASGLIAWQYLHKDRSAAIQRCFPSGLAEKFEKDYDGFLQILNNNFINDMY